MAKPSDMAATMLRNLPDKTGKSLNAWHAILKKSRLEKHGQLVAFLKADHNVTHGFANLIVTKFRESTKPKGESDWVAIQYSGAKTELLPIYEKIIEVVQKLGSDIEVAPKKTYVSLRRAKQFALVQPSTKTRIDLGLNLSGTKPTKRLEFSGSFNAMVTHRVRLESTTDVNKQVADWLSMAYENAK